MEYCSVIESFQPVETFPVAHYDLGDSWNNLSKILTKFKLEFEKTKLQLSEKIQEYQNYKDDTRLMEMMCMNGKSESVKNHFSNLIKERISETNKFVDECTRLTSKAEACRTILTGTDHDKFAKTFSCFACMERPISLFFDPCGHLICASCWTHIVNKINCPVCDQKISELKRIYSI
jgi:hypothetical protein